MTSPSGAVLAVDLGTSGPKAALVRLSGEILDHAFQETPLRLLPGGGAEQDPNGWWEAVLAAARLVLSRAHLSAEAVRAVSVTSQWSGTVPVDREGRCLGNAVIWMDARGAEAAQTALGGAFRVGGYGPWRLWRWISLTGGAPSPCGKDPFGHIAWIKRDRPDLYRRTFKFLEPKDYINLRLTGRFAATFDSIVLHWVTDNRDPDRVAYHEGLLRMAGIERDKLPDLIRAVDVLGPLQKDAADALGLRPDTPVVGGTPDIPSAAVGSGAVRDYEGHLYIGTSSWISAHVPFKKTDLFHCIGSFPSPLPGRYLLLNEQECAGKCLAWLRDNILYHRETLLREEKTDNLYQVLDRIAARVPAGANQVLFTPWLYGERTPVEDRFIRSSLVNLSLENTREDIVRAVFEGVAFNQKWLLQYVEAFMKRPFQRLHFVGGGAHSDIWSQILADVLERPIRQIRDPMHANARGAAFLAGLALGDITTEDIAAGVQVKAEYAPNPDRRTLYRDLFAEYMNLYRRHRRICRRLNKARLRPACAPPQA